MLKLPVQSILRIQSLVSEVCSDTPVIIHRHYQLKSGYFIEKKALVLLTTG